MFEKPSNCLILMRTPDENIIKTYLTLFIPVNISVSLVRNGGMLQQKHNSILMQATYWELSRGFGLSLFNRIPLLHMLCSFTHSPRPPVWSASSGVKVQPAKTEQEAGRGLIWLSPFWTDHDICAVMKSCVRQLKHTVPSPLPRLISFSTRLSSHFDWCCFFRLTLSNCKFAWR